MPKRVFIDEEDTSDTETDYLTCKKPKHKVTSVKAIIGKRHILDYYFIDALHYDYLNWKDCFPKGNVSLRKLIFDKSWDDFMSSVGEEKWFKYIETVLSGTMFVKNIVPHAELVFNAFNMVSLQDIKVVFIGQDPYPNTFKVNGIDVTSACGSSFSLPLNYKKKVQPSLNNIYKNAFNYGHMHMVPKSGCLASWILQGCFMINSALTTEHTVCGAHVKLWEIFTFNLIKYLNEKCDNLVFMVWGAHAHNVCKYVDPKKHLIVTSSHPSNQSCDKTFNGFEYGEFKDE